MKILKFILIGAIALLAIVLIVGLFAPREFVVERSITIYSPKEKILPQITSLKKSNTWSPWREYDPEMKVSYAGTDGKVGSSSSWTGKEVGSGKQEITLITDSLIEVKITFMEPWESTSIGYFKINEHGNGHQITWGMKGGNSYPWNTFCLFMDMDEMIGKDFEKGLNNLKSRCEEETQLEDGRQI
jgi:hypothetical protein